MTSYCQHCGRGFPTEQGLSSHTSRTTDCRAAFRQAVDALRAKRMQENSPPPDVHHYSPPSDFHQYSPPLDVHQSSVEPPRKRQRATVEDVEDEETPQYYREELEGAGHVYGRAQTEFERFKCEQEKQKLDPWAPYRDKDEWELVQWLVKNRITQQGIEAYLRLKIVSFEII
jgi:hypothetical protein